HYSGLVGRVAQLQLAKVRPDVVFLEDPMGRDLPAVTDLRRHDVLLVLDVRRYQQHLLLAAEAAKRNSASVALITDQWLSPVAGIPMSSCPLPSTSRSSTVRSGVWRSSRRSSMRPRLVSTERSIVSA